MPCVVCIHCLPPSRSYRSPTPLSAVRRCQGHYEQAHKAITGNPAIIISLYCLRQESHLQYDTTSADSRLSQNQQLFCSLHAHERVIVFATGASMYRRSPQSVRSCCFRPGAVTEGDYAEQELRHLSRSDGLGGDLAQEPATFTLQTNSPELVHTFAMGVLNPTRDMLCFVKVVAFLSLVYRLHVNYVGNVHIIFFCFSPR